MGALGPISLMILSWQFKFDGNFSMLFIKIIVINFSRHICCHGICKNRQQSVCYTVVRKNVLNQDGVNRKNIKMGSWLTIDTNTLQAFMSLVAQLSNETCPAIGPETFLVVFDMSVRQGSTCLRNLFQLGHKICKIAYSSLAQHIPVTVTEDVRPLSVFDWAVSTHERRRNMQHHLSLVETVLSGR